MSVGPLGCNCLLLQEFLRRGHKQGCGPLLEGPEMISQPESRSKFSNRTTTELCYSYILTMNRGSHHTRVSGVYTTRSLGTDYLKMALQARKVSGAFKKRALVFVFSIPDDRKMSNSCVKKNLLMTYLLIDCWIPITVIEDNLKKQQQQSQQTNNQTTTSTTSHGVFSSTVNLSYITVSAAVRLIPRPPARVLSRKTKISALQEIKS